MTSEGGVLALFDVDKTLVSHDSFRLLGELGARSLFERLLLFTFAVMGKLGWIDNKRYKELVLGRIWRGRSEHERAELLERHAHAMAAYAIDPAWARLRAHLEMGDHVAILSASPEFYLVPYFESIASEIEVHASVVHETPDGVRVDNLYRDAKAMRAREVKQRISPDRTIVYTDHRDDLELMRLADHVVLVRPQETTKMLVEDEGIAFEVLS